MSKVENTNEESAEEDKWTTISLRASTRDELWKYQQGPGDSWTATVERLMEAHERQEGANRGSDE